MFLKTVPVKASETQVVNLMRRTQKAENPLLLALEDVLEPTVVVMNLEDYEKLQHYKQGFYQLQLFQLKQWLDQVEQRLDDPTVRAACVTAWQESMMSLWEVCPEPARGLCASLMLSVKWLDADRLSKQQVEALQYCVELLRSVQPEVAEIDQAYLLLMRSGIPPKLSFDQSLIQSYIDEL